MLIKMVIHGLDALGTPMTSEVSKWSGFWLANYHWGLVWHHGAMALDFYGNPHRFFGQVWKPHLK